jgi:hypothetical protein
VESISHGSRLGTAGAALIVLGALWFAVGAVLLVLALLYGGGPGSLPPSVDVDPNLFAAAPRSAALGILGVAAGAGQLVAGVAIARGGTTWGPRAAIGLALLGAALVAFWLVNGIAAGRPALILLPVLLAYLYVAWASATQGDAGLS